MIRNYELKTRYFANGFSASFANLTKEDLDVLTNIKPERLIVPEETVELITNQLDLENQNWKTLQAIRNSVILELDYNMGRPDYTDYDWDQMTRVSMIIAVIDERMAAKWFTNDLKEAIELLYQAQGLVSQAREIIESVRDEQEEKFDNLPEGLQMSANGERMEERIEMFEDLMSDLENLEDDDIAEVIGNIEEALEN